MKKNYFLGLFFTFLCGMYSFAQTTLTTGDLVVIQLQTDTPDAFRFVPLVDLEIGTIIKFTENGWNGSVLNSNESTITFTSDTFINKGTNIFWDADSTDSRFVIDGNLGFSTSGDQMLVYQGDAASPTFIFAVQSNSTTWQTGSNDTNQSDLPTGLTDGVNAVAAGFGAGVEDEYDNIYYNGITSGTKADILAAVSTASNWVGDNAIGYTPIETNFNITTTSVPSLAISSPSDGATLATTTSVSVSLSIGNFTISADAGGGTSDNSGDGFIKSTFETQGAGTENANFFTSSLPDFTVASGNSYTLTLELVDNTGASLNPNVTATTSFSIAYPCDIQLTTITSSCDASTSGIDTYTTTFAFTGGNTGISYTISALDSNSNPVGTIAGDNPDSIESGNIIVSGVSEGTDFTLSVLGGPGSSCDFTRSITSPTCISLPIYESFSYTENTDLISQNLWSDASTANPANNIQVKLNDDGLGNTILGNYYSSNEFPDQTGNMVSLLGAGSDPFLGFEGITSGTIYASFMFQITDMTSFNNTSGGYFAVLAQNGSFNARLWVKDPTAGATNEGLTFQIGYSLGSTGDYNTGVTFNLAEPVFVVMGYNLDTDEAKLWLVPNPTTFGTATPPVSTMTITDATASGINQFLLRQDSTSETPSIDFDELRIGTSWADVAPTGATASIKNNNIEGFTTFPNPVTNQQFTITSNSAENKQVAIFNVLGKQVFTTKFSGTKRDINVANLSAGIYILKVSEGAKTATSKLVIR